MYGRIFCLLLCIEVIKMGAVIVSAVKEFSRSKRAVLPRDSQKSKIFRKDWARLTESGKHNMNSLQEAMIYTGTTIFLFTDGLTEAMDANSAQFSMERVNDIATKALAQGQQEPRQLIEQMTDAVHQFVAGAEQSDDLTMMAIQYIRPQINKS